MTSTAGVDQAELSGSPGGGRPGARKRRLVGAAVGVMLLAGIGFGAATVVQRVELSHAVLLDGQGPMRGSFWSDPIDAAHEFVEDDMTEDQPVRSAPMRPGSGQGVIFPVMNDSDFPVTVIGSPVPSMTRVQISDRPLDGMPDPASQQFVDTAVLAPGEFRYLKVTLSDEQRCVTYQRGGGLQLTQSGVTVEVAGTTRTALVDAAVPLRFVSQSDSLPAGCPPDSP